MSRPEEIVSKIEAEDGPFDRYVVVGTSGSGKSTIARVAGEMWGHDAVDLDALHWLPGWVARDHAEFRALVRARLDAEERWIVAGNYSVTRDEVWSRADAIVWLDFGLSRTMAQLFRRSIERIVRSEDLWGTGNRESIVRTFASRDSILLWALKTWKRRRSEYPMVLSSARWANLAVFRVTDHGVERWR